MKHFIRLITIITVCASVIILSIFYTQNYFQLSSNGASALGLLLIVLIGAVIGTLALIDSKYD